MAPTQLLESAPSYYVTDGGLETSLIFHGGFDLPLFAACELLDKPEGVRALENYYQQYLDIASTFGTGLLLETATWRASRDWLLQLDHKETDIERMNHAAVQLIRSVTSQFQQPSLISGCLGPRGDGYEIANKMSIQEAADYHEEQIHYLASAGANLVSAFTMNYVEEALGITLAAKRQNIPVVISFTTETDGRLPSGASLQDAIELVDRLSDSYPDYYMINCAHPSHFVAKLDKAADWSSRIKGVRANASRCSHAELDEAETLDEGNPEQLAEEYLELASILPDLRVLGGCCGTDHRHVGRIAERFYSASNQ